MYRHCIQENEKIADLNNDLMELTCETCDQYGIGTVMYDEGL